jgi:hypothetical protein
MLLKYCDYCCVSFRCRRNTTTEVLRRHGLHNTVYEESAATVTKVVA